MYLYSVAVCSGFGILGNKKYNPLQAIFMEIELMVFSLISPLLFHSLSFHSLLVGILMNVIFKSPFGKISLLNKALFSRLAPYIPNANPE